MNDISVVAMFCSDIRQEQGGTVTLVGVFPDNVNLPKLPGAFSQMYIYVRMHLLPSFSPKQIITKVLLPNGSELDRSEIEAELVQRTRKKILETGAPTVGLIQILLSLRCKLPRKDDCELLCL